MITKTTRIIKAEDGGYAVIFNGQLTSPLFNSRGAAQAYLEMLKAGQRKPEYLRILLTPKAHRVVG